MLALRSFSRESTAPTPAPPHYLDIKIDRYLYIKVSGMSPLQSQNLIELEPWEQEILNDFERGEFVSVPDIKKVNTGYRDLCVAFFKERKISLF